MLKKKNEDFWQQPHLYVQSLIIISLDLIFSRASKAFPNQQALKDSGCAPCFTEVNTKHT